MLVLLRVYLYCIYCKQLASSCAQYFSVFSNVITHKPSLLPVPELGYTHVETMERGRNSEVTGEVREMFLFFFFLMFLFDTGLITPNGTSGALRIQVKFSRTYHSQMFVIKLCAGAGVIV